MNTKLKNAIRNLQMTSATRVGPVTIKNTVETVNQADHTNGYSKRTAQVAIRTYWLEGKAVSIVVAARATI